MPHTNYEMKNKYKVDLIQHLSNFQLDDKLISSTNNNINKFINKKKNNNLDSLVVNNKEKQYINNNNNNSETDNNIIEKKPELFKPSQKSPFLWIIYCFINDFNTYEYNKSNLYSIEQEFRIHMIDKIKKNKKTLKQYKLKYNEIEENIIHEKKLNLNSVKAICLIHNINFFYTWKRCFVNFKFNDSNDYILCKINNGITTQLLSNVNDNIDIISKEYFEVTNIKKKILSVSSYTKKDLLMISKKLNLNVYDSNGKEYKKAELYSKILETI